MVAKLAFNSVTKKYHLVGVVNLASTTIIIDYGEFNSTNTNDTLPYLQVITICVS